MEDKYDFRKLYSRQVGKLKPDEANKLGFELSKIVMPYLFPVSEGYTFDLTECFVIGDIKVYKDNIIVDNCCIYCADLHCHWSNERLFL